MKTKLDLSGVQFGPCQVWKNVRLVPLLRKEVTSNLKMTKIEYEESYSKVVVNDKTSYQSYIPFGVIASWGEDETAKLFDKSLLSKKKLKSASDHHFRLIGKVDKKRVRILPFHMAMEAFLSTAFKGPEVRKKEFTNEFNRFGLQCRGEVSWKSDWLNYVNDSLGYFEILENQCGLMIYISDSLASCYLQPNPEDYRKLHYSFLMDCYSDLMWHYSNVEYDVQKLTFSMNKEKVKGVKSLRKEFDRAVNKLSELTEGLAVGLIERDIFSHEVYKLGGNKLNRFRTDFFEGRSEDHIGEYIEDSKGNVQYLKTYRLGIDQLRRGKFLQSLEQNDWDISACAKAADLRRDQWLVEFCRSGLGHILNANTLGEIKGFG